jgi:hypothetical protein
MAIYVGLKMWIPENGASFTNYVLLLNLHVYTYVKIKVEKDSPIKKRAVRFSARLQLLHGDVHHHLA